MYKYKECNQCLHEFNDKNLEPCKDCVPKKKTNADRIRAMSDEELAEFLERIRKTGFNGLCCNDDLCDSDGCDCCMEDWLQSEAE